MDHVCTLFERHYHYGVAALANSLFRQGFRGVIWAGFRGGLPGWTGAGDQLRVGEGCRIRFIPLDVAGHLTNHKPEFMLNLWRNECPEAERLFYFDPDLAVTQSWSYLREWADCGVALCEDVSSPMAANHPRRCAWRRELGRRGFNLRFVSATYVNGGAVGVTRGHRRFLDTWQALQDVVHDLIGGADASKLNGGTSDRMRDPLFAFNASDQDALNATIEACPEIPVSILGADAMGFRGGLAVLPHAVGVPKPWEKRFLDSALRGVPPSAADRAYWTYCNSPIPAVPEGTARRKRLALNIAAAIGRCYRRA